MRPTRPCASISSNTIRSPVRSTVVALVARSQDAEGVTTVEEPRRSISVLSQRGDAPTAHPEGVVGVVWYWNFVLVATLLRSEIEHSCVVGLLLQPDSE